MKQGFVVQQHAAYKTLIDCCVNREEDKAKLLSHLDERIDKKEDVLYELLEFTAIEEINCFVNVGMADGFGPNEWIESESILVLQDQFPQVEIRFPEAKNYEDTKWISLPILKDYDKTLRKHHLQLSYIDNEHYDYLGVVHYIADRDKLFRAFENIGHKCFEISWA